MKKVLLMLAGASLVVFASAQKAQTVYINGQAVQATPVTVNGKAFLQIAVDDLKRVGALTQGGNVNVNAIPGCLGQTLFNGVLRVTLLEATAKDNVFMVRFKVANGTNRALNPSLNASLGSGTVFIADESGKTEALEWEDSAESASVTLTPGASANVKFTMPTPGFTPNRVLFRPKIDDTNKMLPWAKPTSNMEFKLKCP